MREDRRSQLAWLWLPALIWMAVIFYGSNQQSLPTASSGMLDLLIKKTGHVIEYALLGLLAARAWHGTLELTSGAQTAAPHRADAPDNPGWLKPAILAVALGCLYAISDEVHQLFVPTRSGQIRDVILDAAAVTLGVSLLWLWRQLRSRRQD